MTQQSKKTIKYIYAEYLHTNNRVHTVHKAEWDEDEEEWFPRCGAAKRHHKTEWQIEDSTDNIPTDRRKCHDSGCWAEEWDSLIEELRQKHQQKMEEQRRRNGTFIEL